MKKDLATEATSSGICDLDQDRMSSYTIIGDMILAAPNRKEPYPMHKSWSLNEHYLIITLYGNFCEITQSSFLSVLMKSLLILALIILN